MAKKQHKESSKQSISKEKKKSTTTFWERKYAFEILIFAFSFLLFANSIPNDYNMDDELVTINHRLTSKGISAIPEIFTSPYYEDASGYSYEYRPVVLTSFAIEHDIFGENPHWGHFWNVILYGLSCALLFRVLRLLFQNYSPLLSLAITLLFVAHPAHTEVVCSIKNRDEILGLLFSLLSFYWALKFSFRKSWKLILIPFFFTLALLSKTTFIPFIFIISLSILIFTDIGIGYVLYLFLSLFIPALFILNIGNTTTKTFIIIIAFLLSLIIYSYDKRGYLLETVLRFLGNIFDSNRYKSPEVKDKYIGLANLFKNSSPPISHISLKYFLLNLILLGVFVFSAIKGLFFLQITSALIVGLISFEKDETKSFWGVCSLYALMLFKIYSIKLFLFPYFLDFTALPIVYGLIFGKRNLIFQNFIAFVVIVAFYLLKPNSDGALVYPFTVFIILFLQQYKYGWIAIVFNFLIVLIIDFPKDSSGVQNFVANIANTLLVAILAFSVYFKRKHFWVARLFLVFIIGVTVFLNANYESDTKLILKTSNTITSINFNTQSNTNSNRPINYVENCIDYVKTPVSEKAGLSFEVLYHYLHKTVLPHPLSFYYGYSFIKPMKITDTIPLASLCIYVILSICAIFFYRKEKLLSFGLIVYLFSIAVFSNYFQAVPGMIADRFILIPSLGWLIVLVALLQIIFKVDVFTKELSFDAIPKPAKYLFLVILFLYSSMTFSRNSKWENHLTLYRQDINYVDNSSQAHNLLALRLMKESFNEGMMSNTQLEYRKEAAIHFRKAIEIYPPFFNANYDLGRTYQLLGNLDSSIYFYKKTLLIDSSFTNASLSIGELLMQQNKPNEAIPYFSAVMKAFPNDFSGYDKLSYALFLGKDYGGSIEVLKVANQKMTQKAQPRISIAKLYYSTNKIDSAKYWLQKAIEIEPSNQEAKSLLQNLESR